MNLWRLVTIVQYKNDYVKLGSIVDCVFFICIHIDTIEKCVEFNSHVKCRKVSSAKYEEKKKKRESNRIKLVSFFFSFIPFYLRMFFCQSPICMRIPICYSNLSTSLTSDDWVHTVKMREQKREGISKRKRTKKRILMMIFYVFVFT